MGGPVAVYTSPGGAKGATPGGAGAPAHPPVFFLPLDAPSGVMGQAVRFPPSQSGPGGTAPPRQGRGPYEEDRRSSSRLGGPLPRGFRGQGPPLLCYAARDPAVQGQRPTRRGPNRPLRRPWSGQGTQGPVFHLLPSMPCMLISPPLYPPCRPRSFDRGVRRGVHPVHTPLTQGRRRKKSGKNPEKRGGPSGG